MGPSPRGPSGQPRSNPSGGHEEQARPRLRRRPTQAQAGLDDAKSYAGSFPRSEPAFYYPVKGHRKPATAMNLLIVEDEARMSALLRKGLTEEGHIATCASDGAEGLALARSYDFDVII